MDNESTVETIVMNQAAGAVPPAGTPDANAGAGVPAVWYAPAVIVVFLVIALVAAGTGIALGSSSAGDAAALATAAEGHALKGAPPVGACYTYDAKAVEPSTNNSPVVDCAQLHTAETYAVATPLPTPSTDGTWTDAEMQKAGEVCGSDAIKKRLGMNELQVATTRFTGAFFGPSPALAKQGARWIRCDFALTSSGDLSAFTGTIEAGLKTPGAFAVCTDTSGTALQQTVDPCQAGKKQSVIAAAVQVPSTVTDQTGVDALCEKAVAGVVNNAGAKVSAVVGERTSTPTIGTCWIDTSDWKYRNNTWPTEQSASTNVTSV